MTLRKNLHWLLYILFLTSCARQTSPTGGPKDTIPPILLKAVPPNQQINFSGTEVQLNFNEMVALDNPKEQIIITPDVGKDYTIVSKGRQVTLTLKDKLKDSTTYSFNFRESVKDITEKNPANNLKIALSTGTYIDSLSIQGTVYDLLKNKETKDFTVSLYQSDTFNIFAHKPVYVTKTNAKGLYSIENLKPGSYYIFAVDDKNRNLFVDSKTESFGFLSKPLIISEKQNKVNLHAIKLDTRALKLTNSRPYNTYYNIKTSKSLAGYSLRGPSGEYIISSFGEDPANIRIYNTFQQDSLPVKFHAFDSISNQIDTTIFIKFSKRDVKKESFTASKEKFRILQHNGTITGQIKTSKPILSITYDSIFFKIDSLRIINFTTEDFSFDSIRNIITIDKKVDKAIFEKPKEEITDEPKAQLKEPNTKPKKTILNQLHMGKGTFISIELDSSKAIEETVKPLLLEDNGLIATQIKTTETNYIIQLLDKSFNVVHSIYNNPKATFHDLDPAEYMIRVVVDTNGDKRWSPGNFYKKEEPEKVIFYINEKNNPLINLKANWEIGPLLITF